MSRVFLVTIEVQVPVIAYNAAAAQHVAAKHLVEEAKNICFDRKMKVTELTSETQACSLGIYNDVIPWGQTGEKDIKELLS